MRTKKNPITLALIVSSLLLLLVLEGMWLRSSYKNAQQELSREINQLFKTTVLALHDSLMQKNIVAYRGDSASGKHRYFQFHDSLRLPPMLKDSNLNFINVQDKAVRIEIFSSTTTRQDTSEKFLKRIISRTKALRPSGGKSEKTFIVRLGADSLNTDTLHAAFVAALKKADLELPVSIFRRKSKVSLPHDNFITEPVQLNPIASYKAMVENTNQFIWNKIRPQILFAIFSTGLTALSFLILYRSLRSQQRLMEMKNDFIGNITHELKTPISTVSVALEALKGFDALKDPKKTEEYLTMAQNELSRLTLLTDNVLKMTTLEDKGLKFLKSDFDLSAAIERILNSLKLLFEKHHAIVSFEKEGDDFKINGSDIHLTNVVYNLLDNALKYRNSNASISVRLTADDDWLILKVKDNGVGIPKEYHSKIFEKFFRVPTGNIHNTHGYGLGLNYVSEVVHQHKGKIEVKSEPGLGSEFIVTLPKNNKS